ncbi:dGTP triphosphohydrolase [Polyangium aurulentum]|uniref:dGTP triphosphohydrolase n=1 Tax=Polyangium aurulentum TaxID=2567896 RepID=UPI00200FE882|nr:dNTP triphosphohydrolase [Polyangium aurulentum]UQA61420.1 dNTP triphosphohydrolase [Polyangium aurulentum]
MDWTKLMSRTRLTHNGTRLEGPIDDRTEYQRDWDRILFSTAFRRLHDKTQVFPLPEDDVVHSRLTHSLEVASIGRTLGTNVGEYICETHAPEGLVARDFGDVVAAACLAHDIGNPPFGHAGEDAIGSFFSDPRLENALSALTERQRDDLRKFEGNAQGFRIVTRLQLEDSGGLRLTAATLGAFMKYPREVGSDLEKLGGAASKKHGFLQSEAAIAERLATELGLCPYRSPSGGFGWQRHPLAYVVEAADDICNSTLDLEDGARLGHLLSADVDNRLSAIAARSTRYSKSQYHSEPRHRTSYLRTIAIGVLIQQCKDAFVAHEADIISGKPLPSLNTFIACRKDLQALYELAKEKCYQAPSVLELELAGYDALRGLLDKFVSAAISGTSIEAKTREARLLQFLTQRSLYRMEQGLYEQLLRIVDYVSGMTDRYALSLYRRLAGIELPGRIR